MGAIVISYRRLILVIVVLLLLVRLVLILALVNINIDLALLPEEVAIQGIINLLYRLQLQVLLDDTCK